MIRRRFTVLVALMLLVAAGGFTEPAIVTAVEPAIDTPDEAAPVKADLGGDGIFDDLEARLESAADDTEVGVIVRLRARPTPSRLTELGRMVGPLGRTRTLGLVDGFAARLTKRQVNALARHPYVMSVEEDSVIRVANDTAQESFGVSAARLDAGVDGDGDGAPASYSPGDMVAAVLDTGIDAGHRDLDGGKVLAFRDFTAATGGVMTAPYDDHGHGTHVAATIAGDGEGRSDRRYRGVAPAAALVGVKILNANGDGQMSVLTEAIGWVVANRQLYGIEVINLSVGARGCADGTDAASAAVNQAQAAGLVVVVSAGNWGPAACSVGTPAVAAGAITVGSMSDPSVGGFALALSSSRGPTLDGRIKPDIAAPGVTITSALAGTTSSYVDYSGTSMAAPFVAGVALLMRSVAPTLNPQAVYSAMTSTAIDWGRGGNSRTAGSRGPDIEYGHGRLDAYAALKAAGARINAPPAAPAHVMFEGSLSGSGATADHVFNVTSLSAPIAATLIHAGMTADMAARPDFDLYLFNPAGTRVALAETQWRQDSLSYRPLATGQYRLRVRSYSGSGGYFVDVSHAGAPAGPTPTPTPTPTPAPAGTTVKATPSDVAVVSGSYRRGNAASLASNDNVYYVVDSTTSGSRVAAWYGRFTNVPRNLSSLLVTYRGSNTATASQTVSIYRWSDGTWVDLSTRNVGTAEVRIQNLAPPGNASAYVSGAGATGELRVRVRSVRSGSFRSRGEVMRITYSRP